MFGPERIMTASQPEVGSRGVAPETFLLPRPFGNAFFSRDRTEPGWGLRGLSFLPFY